MGTDEREPIKRTWRFCIKPKSGSVYLKEAKRDNDKIIQIDS